MHTHACSHNRFFSSLLFCAFLLASPLMLSASNEAPLAPLGNDVCDTWDYLDPEEFAVCDSFVWRGNLYTESVEGETRINSTTCEIYTLNLLIVKSYYGDTAVKSSCDSLRWRGQLRTVSKLIEDRHVGGITGSKYGKTANCDSVFYLNLTVRKSSPMDTTVTSCGPYFLKGDSIRENGNYRGAVYGKNAENCDSFQVVHLTVLTPALRYTNKEVCDSFLWSKNNQVYKASGKFFYLSGGAYNCQYKDVLNLTINGQTRRKTQTFTACDTLFYRGEKYVTSGKQQKVIPNAVGGKCDSIYIINLTVNNTSRRDTTVKACESFRFKGTNYAASGDYPKILLGKNTKNCDSTINLHLTVQSPATVFDTFSVCDSLLWHESPYKASGDYQKKYGGDIQCDFLGKLHLTIVGNNRYDVQSKTVCDSTRFFGQKLTNSGTFKHTSKKVIGNLCDSVYTLNLTVNHDSHRDTTVKACRQFTFRSRTFNHDTVVANYKLGKNIEVCDSFVTLKLTVQQPVPRNMAADVCDSFLWGDTVILTSGHYYRLFGGANKCDSIITLDLNVAGHTAYDTLKVEHACDSFVFFNQKYTASNTYEKRALGAVNEYCDSVHVLKLQVFHSSTINTTKVACDSYALGDSTFLASGHYTVYGLGPNREGCDSTAVIDLTVLSTMNIDTTASVCDSLVWRGVARTISGDYIHIQATADPQQGRCDTIVRLALEIRGQHIHTYEDSSYVCDSTFWHGHRFTSSLRAKHTIAGAAPGNCDSVFHAMITVGHSSHQLDNEVACDTFRFDTLVFTESGTYTIPIASEVRNIQGCDTTRTLTLVVNATSRVDSSMAACDSVGYFYQGSDRFFYHDTVARFSYGDNAVQCDSSHFVAITVYPTQHVTVYDSACNTYRWYDTVLTHDTEGLPRTLRSSHRCDSIVSLSLKIFGPSFYDTSVTACDSLIWFGGVVKGNVTTTIDNANVHHCDSIIHLHLTLRLSTYRDTISEGCDSVRWNGRTYTQSCRVRNNPYELVNSVGCDSVLYMNITVHPTVYADTVSYDCDSSTWRGVTYHNDSYHPSTVLRDQYGCDSVVSLVLRLRQSSRTDEWGDACGFFIWHHRRFTETGNYTDTLINLAGCDSVVWLHLAVNPAGQGSLNGLFQVSPTRYVNFAKGNLQYRPSQAQWRFAEHQYDIVGKGNNNIAPDYDGLIDLFGWATSGYHNPTDRINTQYLPYATANDNIDYEFNTKGYGPSTNMSDLDLEGISANYDWGMYCAIVNGGSAPGSWRTLTADEWHFLLFERPDALQRRAACTIKSIRNTDSVMGVVLLPETWFQPENSEFHPGNVNGYRTNVYSLLQWETMESSGAVFFPAAGKRFESNTESQGQYGYYWSSTHYDQLDAYFFVLSNNMIDVDNDPRHVGRSVRLAQDVNGFDLPCSTVGDTCIVSRDSVLWHDNYYFETGDYSYLLSGANHAGCDSTAILHLVISDIGIRQASFQPAWTATVSHRDILVSGAQELQLQAYDVQGRLLPEVTSQHDMIRRFVAPAAGIYFLKSPGTVARKVAVAR